VLDVGCGDSGALINRVKHGEYSEGVDCYLPAINDSRKVGVHDKYRNCRAEDLRKYYKANSFDAVVATDLV